MIIKRFKTKFKDPIFILGLLNLFVIMQLTLYRAYLVIFLNSDILVSVVIFTVIVSSINFFQIFLRIPLSALSQLIGRKKVILLGDLAIASSFIVLFFTYDAILAFISALLVAFGMSAYWPASFAFIGDITSRNVGNGSYGEKNGEIFRLGDLGVIIGSLIAKYLLDELLVELRIFFLLLALIGLLSVFIFVFVLPEVLHPEERIKEKISSFVVHSSKTMYSSLKDLTLDPKLSRIYLFQFFISFNEFMFTTFFPLIIVAHGWTKGTVAEIAFWATLVLLWTKPYLGKISDIFGFRFPVLFGFITSSVLMMWALFASDLIIFVVIYFLSTVIFFIGYPAVNGATVNVIDPKRRGIALGALGVYTSLGRTFSTVLLGIVWTFSNLETVFSFTSIFLIVITVFLFLWSRTDLTKTQAIGELG